MDEEEQRAQWVNFGKWVQTRRAQRHPSLAAAARAARISRSSWDNVEKGGRTYKGRWELPSPTPGKLRAIAAGLGVSLLEVYRRAGIAAPESVKDEVPDLTDESQRQSSASISDDLDDLGELLRVATEAVTSIADRLRDER